MSTVLLVFYAQVYVEVSLGAVQWWVVTLTAASTHYENSSECFHPQVLKHLERNKELGSVSPSSEAPVSSVCPALLCPVGTGSRSLDTAIPEA